jgi:hypothetical protein
MTWSLKITKRPPRRVSSYHFRNQKSINMEQFKADIRSSELYNKTIDAADKFAGQLDPTLTYILNVHCPLQTSGKFAACRQENRWLSQKAVAERTRS